jgi:GTP-binding protein HflX
VVHPDLGERQARDSAARLDEAIGLAAAIKLDVRQAEVVKVRKRSPSTLLGKGQVERLAATVAAHNAEVVVIDGVVRPSSRRTWKPPPKPRSSTEPA